MWNFPCVAMDTVVGAGLESIAIKDVLLDEHVTL